jgi:hypothetical protein
MRVIGPEHPTTLATTGIGLVILRDLEMVDEMLELLMEALLIHENALRMDHSRISEVQIIGGPKELALVCHTVIWPAISITSKPCSSIRRMKEKINAYIPNKDLE